MENVGVKQYLGSLESEELIQLADELEQLTMMPGWSKLEQLVQLQREKLTRQITHRVQDSQAHYAHIGGVIKGVEQPAAIIAMTLEVRRALVKKLNATGE